MYARSLLRVELLFGIVLIAAALFAVLPEYSSDTEAEGDQYIGADGGLYQVPDGIIPLTSSGSGKELTSGWYIVEGEIFCEDITIKGAVHIIIANNSVINVNIIVYVRGGYSLSLYAQSTDPGEMGKVVGKGSLFSLQGGTIGNGVIVESAYECINGISGGTIINYPSGIMSGFTRGFTLQGGTVENYGLIETRDTTNGTGITTMFYPVNITNYESGVIKCRYGISLNESSNIKNYGLIESTHCGIYAYGAKYVVNITNYAGGIIKAGIQNGIDTSSGGTVDNYGAISGYHGISAGGNNVINNLSGAKIDGNNNGINVTGNATITNYSAVNGVNYGISAKGTTSIINYGSIGGTGATGSGMMISANTVKIENHSWIGGNYYGIYFNNGGAIDNYGTVFAGSNTGIYCASGVTINNKSTGEIKTKGAGIQFITGNNVLKNDGKIESSASTAVNATGGVIEINNSGTIAGVSGVSIIPGGIVNNTGTISGGTNNAVYGSSGVTVNNSASGVIKSDGFCIMFISGNNVLNNDGLVEGTKSYGIYVSGGISEINNNGTITGTAAIALAAEGKVNNTGTITGIAIGALTSTHAAATLINSGTMNGKVSLGNFANTVTFTVDSVINGDFTLSGASLLNFVGDLNAAKTHWTYSTVTGNVGLSSNVTVNFGDVWPPSDYDGGKIFLIGGAAKVTGTPKNSPYMMGEETFLILAESNALIARYPIYKITASPETITFPDAVSGYSERSYTTIILTNVGDLQTGKLAIYFAGGNTLCFKQYETSIINITEKNRAFISVKPVIGLPPGTSEAILAIGPADGNNNGMEPVYVKLKFTVKAVVTLETFNGIGGTSDFKYKLDGAPGWTDYTGPAAFYLDDDIVIQAAATGYTFMYWLDDVTAPAARTYEVKGNATLTAYFVSDNEADQAVLTLETDPETIGTSEFRYKLDGTAEWLSYTGPVTFNVNDTVQIQAVATGHTFEYWMDDETASDLRTYTMLENVKLTAHFYVPPEPEPEVPPEPEPEPEPEVPPGNGSKYYYITATSDYGSTISPNGVRKVGEGNDKTFFFSAKEGYSILEVTVDGVKLTQAQIDSGYYTFYDVYSNHTIMVKSVFGKMTEIVLIIDVVEGSGRAEYSVNGTPFIRYLTPVYLPKDADVTVIAIADKGYTFSKWETPAVETSVEVSFAGVASTLHLELYFEGKGIGGLIDNDGSFPWLLVALITLLVSGLLLWFVFFYRRSYEVVKVESACVVTGKDRVRRNSKYSFTIEGTGKVSYRIGEDGQWKELSSDPSGVYVIPKGEIADTLTIECR